MLTLTRCMTLSLVFAIAACGDDGTQVNDAADTLGVDTSTLDTDDTSTSDLGDTSTADLGDTSTSDLLDTDDTSTADLVDTDDTSTSDTDDTSTSDLVDTSTSDLLDTDDTSTSDLVDTSTSDLLDTDDTSTSDLVDTSTLDTDDTTAPDTTPPDPCAAPAPDCASGLGVCAFGVSRCGPDGWSACDYGPAHQATDGDEDACDGFDNDCDGATDEGCACAAGGPCGARTLTRLDLQDDALGEAWAIELRAGGDLAFAGELDDGSPWVGVTGLDGTPVWLQRYGSATRGVFRDLEPLPDGGLLAVGWVDLPAPAGSEVLAARLDATGAVVWAQTYGTTANDAAYGVDVRDRRAVIAGDVGNAMLYLELDLDGALVDAKLVKVGTSIEHARDVTFAADGRVVVFGESYDNTGREPVVVDPASRAAAAISAHDASSGRIRPTRDGGFLVSGVTYGYEGDTGVAYSAKLDKDFARVFFVTQNTSYSILYDTIELAGGRLLGAGSNAWAMIVALDANGTPRGGSVYRPLAFGRNNARGLTALPDGGFASVMTDGDGRTWIVRGPATGGAGTCTRDDAWWATTTAARNITPKTATTTALALTSTSILLTPAALSATPTTVCNAPSY